ncbi:MAG: hypothetical protein IKF54_02800 [Eubacterium sp.]|nr:hypothetical protein [Eubacterium sp.]
MLDIQGERGDGMDFVMNHRKDAAAAAVLLMLALVSFFLIGKAATDPANFGNTIRDLDEKSETVMALTGGAAAASAAISLLPGDAGTPIADKLVDMSGYFMLILSAIFLEKWLITITGMLAFRILIPVALTGLAAGRLLGRNAFRDIFIKVICFALVLFITVPAGVKLSQMIDESYQASIEQTIKNAEDKSRDVQDAAGGESDEGALEKIFNSIKGGVTEQIERFRDILSDFVEAAAVLIVTSCVIPLAVMLFFIWLIKMIAGVNITIPDMRMSEKFKGLRATKEE